MSRDEDGGWCLQTGAPTRSEEREILVMMDQIANAVNATGETGFGVGHATRKDHTCDFRDPGAFE